MVQAKKVRISIFIILFSVSVGYFLKIYSLPYSNYKIFISILFFVYIILSVLVKRIRNIILFALSIIIFIYEWNSPNSVPFIVHLLEATIKVTSPVLILLIINNNKHKEIIIKSAILFTFTAHGLLALNIITTPLSFYLMTEKILHLNNLQSGIFLKIVGFLDIFTCIVLFISKQKLYNLSVYYCILWGFLTALARLIYVIDLSLDNIIFLGAAEMLVRIPNSMVPLLLLLINKK